MMELLDVPGCRYSWFSLLSYLWWPFLQAVARVKFQKRSWH